MKVEQVTPVRPDIQITLTHREAQILNRILWHVSPGCAEGLAMNDLSAALDMFARGDIDSTGIRVNLSPHGIEIVPVED